MTKVIIMIIVIKMIIMIGFVSNPRIRTTHSRSRLKGKFHFVFFTEINSLYSVVFYLLM